MFINLYNKEENEMYNLHSNKQNLLEYSYILNEKKARLELINEQNLSKRNYCNLSDGINHLPTPKLYNILQEPDLVQNYGCIAGYNGLPELITIYEKIRAFGENCFDFDDFGHVCVTSGAGAGIMSYLEYFSQAYSNKTVLILGLNYYLFYVGLERYRIPFQTLLSEKKGRIAPTFEEIEDAIHKNNIKLVILTMPMNPSGESYAESDMKKLFLLLKENNILLLLDRCQEDEYNHLYSSPSINKIAYECEFLSNLIIINSISKTRSLPGARIGYIVSDKPSISYVRFCNECTCYCPPSVFVIPFMMDLLCRSIHGINSQMIKRKIVAKFRREILKKAGFPFYQKYISSLLNFLEQSVTQLSADITERIRIIDDNYKLTKILLKDVIQDVTELNGGYNFCIKLRNTSCCNQIDFCSDVANQTQVLLFPESYFNNYKIDNHKNPFWIRLSVAREREEYKKMIMRFNVYCEQNI